MLFRSSAWLYGDKIKNTSVLSRFLLTRGLWFVALEFLVVNTSLMFDWPWHKGFVFVQVLWAIGVSMMLIGENSRTVTQAVKAKLDALRPSLPPGVRIEPFEFSGVHDDENIGIVALAQSLARHRRVGRRRPGRERKGAEPGFGANGIKRDSFVSGSFA